MSTHRTAMTSPPDILRWFEHAHLPAGGARDTADRFADLAHTLVDDLPAGPELSVALRKLLEGKDSAVRAALTIRGGERRETAATAHFTIREDGTTTQNVAIEHATVTDVMDAIAVRVGELTDRVAALATQVSDLDADLSKRTRKTAKTVRRIDTDLDLLAEQHTCHH